jgi:hypothetical protein
VSIDTLEASRGGYNEFFVVKVMSGGGVMASPRYLETDPRELKPQEGNECWAGLTHLPDTTDRYLD